MTENNYKDRKILFAHDGPLEVLEDGTPLGVSFTEQLITRYKYLGNKIQFLLRQKKVDASKADFYSKLVADNFKFVPVPNPKGIVNFFKYGFKAHAVVRVHVKQSDIVIARMPSTIGSWAFLYAKYYSKPVMVEFVACTWGTMWNYSWKGKIAAPYYTLKNKILMLFSDKTVYVTERYLQKRYPCRGQSINISNVELNESDESVLQSRLQTIDQKQNGQKLTLATIAAVDVHYKNQALVIRALADLKSHGQADFLYRVVGQGDQSKLAQLAKNLGVEAMIEFTGPVKHSMIFDLLDRTDIYIQPSHQEGLPRAVIEALSRACCVLGSEAGGIPELISADRQFDSNSVSMLSEKIRNLTLADLRSDAVRNWEFSKNFSKDNLTSKRNGFYDKFLHDYGFIC